MTMMLVVCALAAHGTGKPPFSDKWQKAVVIWDFRKNELICHGETAKLVGEEEPQIVVGTDNQGHEVRQKYRLLTYRCDEGKHAIRIWMEDNMDLIREVSCHGSNICENKGYEDDDKGNVLHCSGGGSEGHKLILLGTEKETH